MPFINTPLTIIRYYLGGFGKRVEMVYYPNIWKG